MMWIVRFTARGWSSSFHSWLLFKIMNQLKLRRATDVLFACFVLILAAGCASTRSYVEPSETAGPAAKVEATAPVWILSIDGRPVSGTGFDDTRSLRLTPGRHEVVVTFRTTETVDAAPEGSQRSPLPNKVHRPTVSQPVKIPITAKPGFNYVIQFERDAEKKQVVFWVGEFEDIKPSDARELKPKF